MKHRTLTAFFAALLLSSVAAANGPARLPRYRVSTIESPALSDPACLPAHTIRTIARGINDAGTVVADYTCFIADFNGIPALQSFGRGFVWSSWLGAQVIPLPAGSLALNTLSINNRGEVFGREFTLQSDTFGIQWSPHGAYQRVFEAPPECSKIDGASAGNVRGYSVGFGLRPDLAAPGFCAVKWLIKSPAGAVTEGPVGGQPWDINAFDVVVGDVGSAAVKLHAPSNRMQVLFAGDATSFGRAQDINNLGEVSGYLSAQNKFCGQATAVRWERDGRMRTLPHLRNQVSSRAHGVGNDGDVVGQSGPGLYCDQPYSDLERAVLWHDRSGTDLNGLIPAWLGITLTRAVGINQLGQIVAMGYRNDEPLTACPKLSWDENDNPVLDYSQPCRNIHAFVLTPIR